MLLALSIVIIWADEIEIKNGGIVKLCDCRNLDAIKQYYVNAVISVTKPHRNQFDSFEISSTYWYRKN